MSSELMIIIAAVLVAAGAICTFLRNREIKVNGIEAEATVSRVEEHSSTDSDGDTNTSYTYYVTYRTAEGNYVEAELGNPLPIIREGDRIRIKYLPEKPKYAVRVRES